MEYAEFEPPAALADIVRCFWVLRAGPGALERAEPAIPDGSPELILSLASVTRARAPSGRMVPQPGAMLVGQITRPFSVQAVGAVELVAARLHPYGAAWLCARVDALTDGWMSLGAPFAAARRSAQAARGAEARVAILAQAMLAVRVGGAIDGARREAKRVAVRDSRPRARVPGPDARVIRAVDAIVASHGAVPMATLARDAATTPRQLQRLFARDVGVSPKLLARIRRVQRVFAAWRDEPGRWTRVAAECGYFDQAHRSRDFREIAGGAPAGLVEAMPRFTRQFTALR